MKIWSLIAFFVMSFVGIGNGEHYEKEQKVKQKKESYTHQMAVCPQEVLKKEKRKNFQQKPQNLITL